MWPFDIKQRRAARVAEAERQERIRLSWSAPACEALLLDGKKLVISEKIGTNKVTGTATVRVVPVAGSTGPADFKSTGASQWSTSEYQRHRRALKDQLVRSPLNIVRTRSGKIVGLQINQSAVADWKWLAKNPAVVAQRIKRRVDAERFMTRQIQDSALFI